MSSQLTDRSKLIGGSLLVAGNCIGAAMLGLPLLTREAGFFPSVTFLLLSYLFMGTTALLLLEAISWFDDVEINLVSMAEKTLGKPGKAVAWVTFLFLFYCLMVAYVAGSGALVADFVQMLFGVHLPGWISSLPFVLIFGVAVYLGTLWVDEMNRFCMLGLIVAYLALIGFGIAHVETNRLLRASWSSIWVALPAMVVSFGFHNLLPSLNTYFDGNLRVLRKVVFIGSGIPLVIYLIWTGLVLGVMPETDHSTRELATNILHKVAGDEKGVTLGASSFAFFAIVTSILGVALSFVDFLSDGFHWHDTRSGRVVICLLVFVPPYVLAQIDPAIFLKALGLAGGFGAVILFGVLPALMVWKERYYLGRKGDVLVPGGRLTLCLVLAFAFFTMAIEFIHELGRL